MEINITTPSTFEIEIGNSGNVYSVNGKVGTVVLNASDVHALPDTTSIPNKTSDLTNDSGFITSSYHDASKQDVISDLSTIRAGATAGSTAVQPAAITDMATKTWTQAQGYLTEHQSLTDYSTTAQMNAAISAYHDNTKQDVISDLNTIRSGASAGATAVQPSAITDMATKTWTQSQGYLTEHQSLQGYATEQWVENKGYLTEHQSLAAYRTAAEQDLIHDATKQDVISDLSTIRSGAALGATAIQEHQSLAAYRTSANQDIIDATKANISDIPTKTSELTNDSGFLTEHQSLAAYRTSAAQDVIDATKANSADLATVATSGSYNDLSNKPTIPVVPTNVSAFTNDAGYLTQHQSLSGYATESWVEGKGYLTEHQSLSAYRTSAAQDVIDAGKQGTLTAGSGISIVDNVISATGSGSPEIAWFDYETVTLSDVNIAIAAGKQVLVRRASTTSSLRYIYALVEYSANNTQAIFQSINGNNGISSLGIQVCKLDSNGWTEWLGRIVPASPSMSGTYVLKCIDGSLQWVQE